MIALGIALELLGLLAILVCWRRERNPRPPKWVIRGLLDDWWGDKKP